MRPRTTNHVVCRALAARARLVRNRQQGMGAETAILNPNRAVRSQMAQRGPGAEPVHPLGALTGGRLE
jgi:hypothetical protein